MWLGGGIVTRDGKGVFFTIPFIGANNRWSDIGITCTELKVRKANGYLIESLLPGSPGDSDYTFTYTGTPLGINVSVVKDSQIDSSITNGAVGIQFVYNLTVNSVT